MPTSLSREAAAQKAAKLLGSADNFTMGYLAHSFGQMGSKKRPEVGGFYLKRVLLGFPGEVEAQLRRRHPRPSPHLLAIAML